MIDVILAVLAIAGLVAYFVPLVMTVYGPALIAILCLVILMAAYDFARELRANRSDD